MATAGELERGKFFTHNNEIVQVVRKDIVTYGTHCHSKLKLTVCDIYGKKEKIINLGHNDRVDILDIMKKTGTLIAKNGFAGQIMDSQSYETFDIKIDGSLADMLKEGDEIVFVNANTGAVLVGKK